MTGEWSQSQKSWGEGESSPWTVLHSMHTDGTGDGGTGGYDPLRFIDPDLPPLPPTPPSLHEATNIAGKSGE